MWRNKLPWCLPLVVLLAAIAGGCALGAEVPQGIIFIGWDGAQRAHVQEMLERSELPTLAALAAEGTMVDVDVNDGATDTKAGWTQILTGYKPDTTGVFSNSKYQPIPEGYSVFERLESFYGSNNIVTMGIIGKKGHVDADAPRRVPFARWEKMQARAKAQNRKAPGIAGVGGTVIEENGKKFVEIPGKPWYNAQSKMDLFLNGLQENDVVGNTALEKLEASKDKRFFFFVHFADPDHSGHKSGENSQEYTDGIKSDDDWTGKIIAKLKDLGLYEKTLVYVVVDHGFNEGTTGHRYAPYVFLGTNDQTFVRKQGDRADIAAHALKRFGLDLSTIEPALDGIPYDQPAAERRAPVDPPARKGVGAKRQNAGQQARPARQGARAGKAKRAAPAADEPAEEE